MGELGGECREDEDGDEWEHGAPGVVSLVDLEGWCFGTTEGLLVGNFSPSQFSVSLKLKIPVSS